MDIPEHITKALDFLPDSQVSSPNQGPSPSSSFEDCDDTPSEPFTEEEFEDAPDIADLPKREKWSREGSDMNEDFGSYAKESSKSMDAMQKRRYKMEQKIQSVDFTKKKNLKVWANPILGEIVEMISDHLGIPQGDVYQAAILMFYRNCFNDERGMIYNLAHLIDGMTLTMEELKIDAQALEDTANLAVELELSPLHSKEEI